MIKYISARVCLFGLRLPFSFVPYVTKFLSVLIFADERAKKFRVDLFSWALQKLCFACINFREKSKNAKNREILCMRKFSAVRYVSWSQWIENLYIIDQLGVQHQMLDQTQAWKNLRHLKF